MKDDKVTFKEGLLKSDILWILLNLSIVAVIGLTRWPEMCRGKVVAPGLVCGFHLNSYSFRFPLNCRGASQWTTKEVAWRFDIWVMRGWLGTVKKNPQITAMGTKYQSIFIHWMSCVIKSHSLRVIWMFMKKINPRLILYFSSSQ